MRHWIVFVAAVMVWSGYFYGVDTMIMEGQGLPVSANLMPK